MDDKTVNVIFPNENRSVRLIPGNSVMDALLKADLKVDMACGGNGICGKCVVRLISGKLEGGKIENDYFLACMAIPLTDCEIEIVNRQEKVETVPFTGGIIPGPYFNPPSLQSLNPGDTLIREALGAAIDIGTTTVAGVLCRLSSGEILGFSSKGNPQSIYGADVISRITHASDSSGVGDLHRLIVKCVNEMIGELCHLSKTDIRNLIDIVISGNAAMNHLFIGESPASLGYAPYKPVFKIHEPVPAVDVEIPANSKCTINLLPNIAGFVGGDAVAGILATETDRSSKPKLLIDIGTNGEIVLSDGKNLYACSAAAGPAFEGGRIFMGMRAEDGAIRSVSIGEDVRIDIIGQGEPRGICGSGLIGAVSEMLSNGLVDISGRFPNPEFIKKFPERINERFVSDKRGRKFILFSGAKKEVAIYEKDISELMLAKAAIRAAIEIALSEANLKWENLSEISIAGAFGAFLRPEDMIRIGLISECAGDIEFVGNTSLKGAVLVLLSDDARREAESIASRTIPVELASNPDFENKFTGSIPFPG